MLVFSKLVGQASIRTSEVGRTLEKFGIQIKDANGESRAVEAVFLDLMKALDGVENAFERNAILADVFGRAGLKMSVLMKDGSEAMKDLAESADGIIDEKTIRNAEAFNDTMARLKRQVLEPLQSAFINTSKAVLDFAEAMGLIKPDLFTKSTEELNTALTEQKDILDRLLKSQKDTQKSNYIGQQQIAVNIKKAEEEKKRLEQAIAQRERQIEVEERLQTTLTDTANSQQTVNNTIKESIIITKSFADTIDGQLTTAFTNFFDATNKQFLDFKDLAITLSVVAVASSPNILIFSASLKKYGGGVLADCLTVSVTAFLAAPLPPKPINPDLSPAIPAPAPASIFKNARLPMAKFCLAGPPFAKLASPPSAPCNA